MENKDNQELKDKYVYLSAKVCLGKEEDEAGSKTTQLTGLSASIGFDPQVELIG